MSAWISLVIFVEIIIIIVPCFSITLDCHQAKDIHSFITSNPLLKSLFNTISIGNCQDFTLNLSKPLPMPISSLQLVNMTNLSFELDTVSLNDIHEIVIIQSYIVGNAVFVSTGGTRITVENSVFQDDVLFHQIQKKGSVASEILFVSETVFKGNMDIVIKVSNETTKDFGKVSGYIYFSEADELNDQTINDTAIEASTSTNANKDTLKNDNSEDIVSQTDYNTISLLENIFQNQPNIYTEKVNPIFIRNIFNIKKESTIGTIIAPGSVNITNNTFQEDIQVKFASVEYINIEKQIDKIEPFFDILFDEVGDKIIYGNRYVMKYVQFNRIFNKYLFHYRYGSEIFTFETPGI